MKNRFNIEASVETDMETVEFIELLKEQFTKHKIKIVYLNKLSIEGHVYGIHEEKFKV